MATYGPFEVVEELYPGRSGSVLLARRGGTAAGDVVVKTFRPPVAVVGAAAAERQLELFLARARLQRSLAELKGSAWAPILRHERASDEAYYATHYYPRSARTLIDGGVRVTAATLHEIANGVVDGLYQIKTANARPHGNLKPSNVLIGGQGRIQHRDIALTDPATDERARSVGESADLTALGRLICEMVMRREIRGTEDWSGPAPKEWSRLGSTAGGWRNLCRRLIEGGENAPSIESLKQELARLSPRHWRRRIGRIIASAAVLSLAAAIVWEVREIGRFRKDWQRLCDEYKGLVIPIQNLHKDLTSTFEYFRPEVHAFLVDKEHAKALDTGDPRNIRSGQQFGLEELPQHPPDVFPPFGAEARDNTRKGLREGEKLRERWKEWPLRDERMKQLEKAAQIFEPGQMVEIEKVLQKRAEDLAKLEKDNVQIPDPTAFLRDVEELEKAQKLSESADGLLKAFGEIGTGEHDKLKIVEPIVDPLFAKLLTQTMEVGDPPAVQLAIDNLRTTATRMRDRIRSIKSRSSGIDDFLRNSEPKWRHSLGSKPSAQDVMDEIMGDLQRYQPPSLPPDPREKLHADIDERKKELDDVKALLSSADKQLLEANLGEIKTALDLEPLAWSVASQPDVQQQVNVANEQLRAWRAHLDNIIQSNRNQAQGRAAYVDQVTMDGKARFERNPLWSRQWEIIQQHYTGQGQLAEMKKKVEELNELVLEDAPAAQWPDDLPNAKDLQPALKAAVSNRFEKERRSLVEGLTASPSANDPPRLLADKKAEIKSAAEALLKASAAAEKSLSEGVAVKESVLAVINNNDLLTDSEVRNQWRRVLLLRVEVIKSVDGWGIGKLREELKNENGPPEVTLAVWRKLKDLTWPESPTDLDIELSAERRLRERMKNISDEINSGGVDRVKRFARKAPADQRTAAISLNKAALFVTALRSDRVKVALDPDIQFNFALARLNSRLGKLGDGATKDSIAPIIDEFKRDAGALPDPVAANVQKELDAAAAPSGRPLSGPPLDKWELLPESSDSDRFFRKKVTEGAAGNPLDQHFVKLDVSGTGVFLLSSEVSLGLFKDLYAALDAQKKRDNPLHSRASGPMAWDVTGPATDTIELRSNWFNLEDYSEGPAKKHIDEYVGADEKGHGDEWASAQPANYISPGVAATVAAQAGCRLPTVAEWNSAIKLQKSDPNVDANLRDQSWKVENRDWSNGKYRMPVNTKDIFRPSTYDSNDVEALSTNDHILWFRAVGKQKGGPFSDLVGNVAEYVTMNPVTPEQIVAGKDRRVYVIGGSALSPLSMHVNEAQPVPDGEVADPIGYSDVGFRLAFSETEASKPLLARILALTQNAYQNPPKH